MELQINILARAKLPSRYGSFEIVSFEKGGVNLDHVAVVRGKLDGASKVPTRLHSECLTGDVFHSCRCDCRQQLEYALMHFALLERSLILYMRQEGRGIGIANKVAAYSLQEKGMDTVEANHHLGFDDDMRTYDEAAGMLRALGIESIELYTNNPQKIDGLRKLNIEVTGRSPIVIPPNGVNDFYLKTKQQKSGHMLNIV